MFFWWHPYDFLCLVSCHLQAITILLLFLFGFLLFLFSFMIVMVKTSKTMLNNTGESGHLYLIPDLKGNAFSFSPLRIMFAMNLLYMTFIMLKKFLYMPISWSAYHKYVLNFVKNLYSFLVIIICFLFFILLKFYIMLIDLHMLNTFISGINVQTFQCRSARQKYNSWHCHSHNLEARGFRIQVQDYKTSLLWLPSFLHYPEEIRDKREHTVWVHSC